MPAADTASPNQDSARLVRAGYGVILRYVSRLNVKTKSKIITPGEYQRHVGAGLRVILNYEWYETRCQEGAPAGREDVAIAKAKIGELGYPAGDPVYFSDDTGATTRNQLDAYFGAVGEQLPADHIGYYGGLPKGLWLLERGRISKVWAANAASWSALSSWRELQAAAHADGRVHFLQHLNSDQPLGWDRSIDHNDILRADYAGGANNMPLDPNNPNDARVIDAAGKMQTMWAIITGDPAANAKPNFFTDLHTAAGIEARKLDALNASIQQLAKAASPAPTDVPALAAALAPLLNSDETQTLLDALHERLAS